MGTTRFLLLVASRFGEINGRFDLLLAVGWRIAVVGALLGAMIGIFGRKQWGRWLACQQYQSYSLECSAPDTTV
jgi:hypothetical protein